MCDDETKAILRAILDATSGDDYEPGGVFTVGGPTGSYVVKSPYNTECEYSLVFASTTGATGDANIMVSNSNPTILSNPANQFGLVSGGNEQNNAFEGWALHVTSTGASPIEVWQPLGRGGYVYVNVVSIAGNALVQIAFRRKMLKYIPNKPRVQPHTHSHPQSRRDIRAMYAQSKMLSGFEAQYPELANVGTSGKPYLHEPIPEDQDVENIAYTQRRLARTNRSNG